MSIMQLVRAAESADNNENLNVEQELEVATTVADESAEIQQDSGEIAVEVSTLEDAVQDGEELEAYAEQVAEAVESGEGLAPEHAETLSIAVESIRHDLGIWDEPNVVPAAEHWGTTDSRLYSTKLVGEAIKDTIRKAWTAIKQLAQRVWERIKLFLAKVIGSASSLSKQISALKERARKVDTGAKPKEKTLKSPRLARDLNVKNKADLASFKTIAKNTEGLAALSGDVAKLSRDIVAEVVTLTASEVNNESVKKFASKSGSLNQTIESKIAAALNSASSAFSDAEVKSTIKVAKSARGQRVAKAYGPFVGSTVLNLVLDKNGDFITVNLSFGSVSGKVAQSVEALTAGECLEVLNESEKIANKLADFKRTMNDYESANAGIQKAADKVISSAENILSKTGSETETRQGLSAMRTQVNDAVALLNTMGNRAPGLLYNVASAGANYASLSLSNLKAA